MISSEELEEFMEIIRGRRSIRRFRKDQVRSDIIEQLIEAASWAPSASNRQDWFFTVVTSPDIKGQMAQAVRRRWEKIVTDNRDIGFIDDVKDYASSFASFEDAPVLIAVSAKGVDSVQRRLLGDAAAIASGSLASAAMAAENLMLAAHALGLGTCPMTGALAAGDELKMILGIKGRREIVCLIGLGYPDESPSPPPRKPVKEITRYVA